MQSNNTNDKSVKFQKRLSSEQIADLHQRAQRARQLEEKDEWQSVVSSKSSNYDDLPPLEDLQPKRVSNLQKARAILELKRCIDEDKDGPEPNRVSNLQKARVRLKLKRFIDEDKDSPEPIEIKEAEKRREQKRDNAAISSTVPQRQTRTHKETIDYSTGIYIGREAQYKKKTYISIIFTRSRTYRRTGTTICKHKEQGKKETGRTYLVGLVEKLINSKTWTTEVNDELLRKRMNEWRDMKGKGKATKENISFYIIYQ